MPIIYDKKHKILDQFDNFRIPFISLTSYSHSVSLNAVNEPIPDQVTRLSGSYQLFRHRSEPANYGHSIWEEFGSLYYTQRRLMAVDRNVQVLHVTNMPNTYWYQRFVNLSLPAISNNPLANLGEYLNQVSDQDVVCFERMILGSTRAMFFNNDLAIQGWEEVIFDYRSKIIENFGIVPCLPNKALIVITDKSFSEWTSGGAKLHRAIANINEVETFLRKEYPFADVQRVRWHEMNTSRAEIELLSRTSILITPCGGVSFNAPFVPMGAHVIFMDYLSDGSMQEIFGFAAGESASMDVAFWNRFWHFNSMFYQIYDDSDFVWDFPGGKVPRSDASIVIKLDRIKELVDNALINMNYI